MGLARTFLRGDDSVRSRANFGAEAQVFHGEQGFGQATASMSHRAATLWTWIARRQAAGRCDPSDFDLAFGELIQ